MATTNINVRVDASLKKDAEKLFNELGLNMSSAITMFLKSAVSYEGIPFEIKRIRPNVETKAALNEHLNMKDKTKYRRYESFDDVIGDALNEA